MGVLIVIFERKVSNSFLMLCSLYSDVEDIFFVSFTIHFIKICILGFKRERENALLVIPSWERRVYFVRMFKLFKQIVLVFTRECALLGRGDLVKGRSLGQWVTAKESWRDSNLV